MSKSKSTSKSMKRRGAAPSRVVARPDQILANKNWVWGLFLVVATVLVYQQAWRAGFIWDDDLYVTENKLLTAPDGLRRIWFSLDSPSQYFPLVYTTFRLERLLWGLNPAGYHWVNILLHAANAVLVWRVLAALRIPGAWLAAAIFALHPVQVESVAWITERKNVLMGLFFLLALLAWVRFVEAPARQRSKYYGLALLFYALALFSKTTACTLPAALLLVLWLKKVRIDWRRLVQVAPFVALGIAMGLVTLWWERYHQGTRGDLFQLGVPERFLLASRALWFYAGKLLWPGNLVFSYPRWSVSVGNLLDYTWLLAAAAAAAAIYFARHRLGRGPEVAVLFFVATLSPLLGFVMLYTFRYSFVADHYQYLASIGPLALAAAGITNSISLLAKGRRFLGAALCAVLLLSLAFLSWRQCAMYADWETLWSTTIAKNPDSSMAHNNLAIGLALKGREPEAIAHFNKALELNPDLDEAHYSLANTLMRLDREEEAVAHYEAALKINPRNTQARYNLAVTLVHKGRLKEAIAHYNRILEINPNDAVVHHKLGVALGRAGQADEAVAQLRQALRLNPQNAEAHYDLGNTLLVQERLDDAMAQYNKALQLSPGNAATHQQLANVLRKMGRIDEANLHLQKALEAGQQRPR